MAINYDTLINWKIPAVEQQLTKRDTMLYAVGVGLGADPCDEKQLRFVYEENLVALPTMAIVLACAGAPHANADTGITRSHVLHGEQGFTIHRPLPVEGAVTGLTDITDVIDKGKDKGALVLTKSIVRDKATQEIVCTLTSTSFCRADGGFGGPSGPVRTPHAIPERAPDLTCDLPTLPRQRSSIGCRVTTTRCTPIRLTPRKRDTTRRSCTVAARSASRGTRC